MRRSSNNHRVRSHSPGDGAVVGFHHRLQVSQLEERFMEVMQVNDAHLWKRRGTENSQEHPRLQVTCRCLCGYQEERSRDEDLCEEDRNGELLQSNVLQPGDTSEVDTVRRSRGWRVGPGSPPYL